MEVQKPGKVLFFTQFLLILTLMVDTKSSGFEATTNFDFLASQISSSSLDLRNQVFKLYVGISSIGKKFKSEEIRFIAALQHPFKKHTCFSVEELMLHVTLDLAQPLCPLL